MSMKKIGLIQEIFRRLRGKGFNLGLEKGERYKDNTKEKGNESEDIIHTLDI